ncbi:MAG: FAD-dependent oxidoreductase [Spirochaetota bacterium]
MQVNEPNEFPVLASVDVLIAGGGVGGIAAALASARAGAKTMLIERSSYTGGVATACLVTQVLNCYYTADHRLAITGIPLEIADALAEAEGYGKKWHDHKGHILYDVESAKLVFDRLLTEAGVTVQYNTVVSGVVKNADTLSGLIIESASGREVILAKTVIDATGDAAVALHAGVPVHAVMPWGRHSFCFRFGNVEIADFVAYLEKHPGEYPDYLDVNWTAAEALASYRALGTFMYPHASFIELSAMKRAIALGDFKKTSGVYDSLEHCQLIGVKRNKSVCIIPGMTDLPRGVNAGDISHAITDGRTMAKQVAELFNKYIPGFEHAYVSQTADYPGIRGSRWIDGDFVFTNAMRETNSAFDDRIARSVVQLNTVKGKYAVMDFTNGIFDIPYRTLMPRGMDGLIMGSGRTVSVEHPFLLRLMPVAMAIGQAAGTAAAVAAKTGKTARTVNVSEVQSILKQQGVSI